MSVDPFVDIPTVVLHRPDGRLQVGVGPLAIVVEGLGGDTALTHGLARELARQASSVWASSGRLAADRVGAGLISAEFPAPRRCAVRGSSQLARRLRRRLDAGLDSPDPDVLLVLVHHHVVPPEAGLEVARSGQSVLPVVVQWGRVVIGPVCLPGQAPCLHCLDLDRRDRDRDWPVLATELAHPLMQLREVAIEPMVAHTVEGLTALLARSVLAGEPVLPGQAIEVGSGTPHVVTRQWQQHPGCPLHT